jgi:hypothetical protein
MKPVMVALALVLFLNAVAYMQEEEPKDLVPPAPKILTEKDEEQIRNAGDIRKQAEIALLLMEEKLKEAEMEISQQNYRGTLNALGRYHALLDYSLGILVENVKKDKKTFKALKEFEISLRQHTPRLELIRREMPYSYGWYVQRLIKIVRQARAKVIEPMYGEAV